MSDPFERLGLLEEQLGRARAAMEGLPALPKPPRPTRRGPKREPLEQPVLPSLDNLEARWPSVMDFVHGEEELLDSWEQAELPTEAEPSPAEPEPGPKEPTPDPSERRRPPLPKLSKSRRPRPGLPKPPKPKLLESKPPRPKPPPRLEAGAKLVQERMRSLDAQGAGLRAREAAQLLRYGIDESFRAVDQAIEGFIEHLEHMGRGPVYIQRRPTRTRVVVDAERASHEDIQTFIEDLGRRDRSVRICAEILGLLMGISGSWVVAAATGGALSAPLVIRSMVAHVPRLIRLGRELALVQIG